MPSILCVHGVGHGDADPKLQTEWTSAIADRLTAWNPDLAGEIRCDFLTYDQLFAQADLNPITYAKTLASVLASSVKTEVGNLFGRSRGLFDIPDRVRWTAGMVAQWIADDDLKQAARNALLDKMKSGGFDVVCAHSLGSLICYDAFLREPDAIAGSYFVTLGSQIGNPCVRDQFAGRLLPLNPAREWFHLFNPDDHVFTSEIRVTADNFREVGTPFDIPNDPINHDAIWYFKHPNTHATVWRTIAGVAESPTTARGMRAFDAVSAKPTRRALLVGINDYPDPANKLEGCVNDVFLMSSLLQECGFMPDEIRVTTNERATAGAIRERLRWLLDGVRAGDQRVLFYSGHGAQIPAYGPSDEVDHFQECLVPYDFDWTAQRAITDKDFCNLYSQLPYDSHFVAIFDCCHSGGMTRGGGHKVRGIEPPDDIRHRALQWNVKLKMWEDRPLPSQNPSLAESPEGKLYLGGNGATCRLGRAIGLRKLPQSRYDQVRQDLNHAGPYLPIIMEACREDQLSYEYRHGTQSYGAFTYALGVALRDHKGANPNFIELMKGVSSRLKKLRYDQNPVLIGAQTALKQQVPWMRSASQLREITQAREFVSQIELPQLRVTRAFGAREESRLVADQDQAVVVGSEVLSFVKGVSLDRRQAVIDATLLAQLAAKKKTGTATPDNVEAWYGAYFDVLAHIGWSIRDSSFTTYEQKSGDFSAFESILDVAETLFAEAPSSLKVIKTTLDALRKDTGGPWIRIYARESEHATAARFQVGLVEQDGAGEFSVSLMAFALKAKSEVTQVLFFKAKMSDVTLRHFSGRIVIDTAVLDGVRNAIQSKLIGVAGDYVSLLPDLA